MLKPVCAIVVGLLFSCILNAQQTGTIVFFREGRFATGDFKPQLFCDNIEVARIENGAVFELTAPAGLHNCAVESLQQPPIQVVVTPGTKSFIHVQIKPGWTDHASLTNTTEAEYTKQASKLKPQKEWSRNSLTDSPASAVPTNATVKEPSGKFGDLAIRASKLSSTPARYSPDRDELAAFITASNTGQGVVCATLAVTLKTTFDLEYRGVTGGSSIGGFPAAPRIDQMLPGESTNGSYVFEIKHGVQPVELVIQLASRRGTSGYIRCGTNSPLRDIFVTDEIRIDLRNLPVEQPAQ